MDTSWTRILQIKSEVSNTIRHDTLPILKYPCIIGERRLFIRSDELDVAWKLFTPLLKELEDKKITPELYSYGSTGPIEAHNLASKYNVKWGDLSTDNY
ncbi:hypothetical protein AAC387_Pa01g2052 [Persea americana]